MYDVLLLQCSSFFVLAAAVFFCEELLVKLVLQVLVNAWWFDLYG